MKRGTLIVGLPEVGEEDKESGSDFEVGGSGRVSVSDVGIEV